MSYYGSGAIYGNGVMYAGDATIPPGTYTVYRTLRLSYTLAVNAPSTSTINKTFIFKHTIAGVPDTGYECLFKDGFETGNFTNWYGTLTTQSISTTRYHGSYGMYVNPGAGTAGGVYKTLSPSYDALYARGYVKFIDLPSSSGYALDVIVFEYVGWHDYPIRAGIYCNSNNDPVWCIQDGYGGVKSYGTTPTTNRWYCVEAKFVKNGACSLWVDGQFTLTVNAQNFNTDQIVFGQYANVESGNAAYYDNFIMDDTGIDNGYLFMDNFETGDFSRWTDTSGGGWTVSTLAAIHGDYGARAYGAYGDPSGAYKTLSQDLGYVRAYFKVASLPVEGDGCPICGITQAAAYGSEFGFVSLIRSGGIYLLQSRFRNNSSWVDQYATITGLSINQTHYVEIKAVRSSIAGEFKAYLDGTLMTSSINLVNNDRTSDAVTCGNWQMYSGSIDLYVDAIVASANSIGAFKV